MQRDVSHIFNKFAGREVAMTERTETIDFKSLGKQTFTVIEPANKDEPLFKEMQDEAKKHGFSLRLFWPGMGGTADFRTDRVNAHIEKGTDGKWRVGKSFGIG
jgi:hypothetical protein